MDIKKEVVQLISALNVYDGYEQLEQLSVYADLESEEVYKAACSRIFGSDENLNEMLVTGLVVICAQINKEEFFKQVVNSWKKMTREQRFNIEVCAERNKVFNLKDWLLLFNHPSSNQGDRKVIFGAIVTGELKKEFHAHAKEYIDILWSESVNDWDHLDWLRNVAESYGLVY